MTSELGTRWREWSASSSDRFNVGGNSNLYPSDRNLIGSQSRSGRFGGKINVSSRLTYSIKFSFPQDICLAFSAIIIFIGDCVIKMKQPEYTHIHIYREWGMLQRTFLSVK